MEMIHEEIRALNLGARVRQLRLRQGMTLQNLSDFTGLSKPLLSQIENNLAVPPIATLLKISKALGVSIGYFFQDAPSSTRIAVVRKEDRKRIPKRAHEEAPDVGYRYESLAHPMSDKTMEPFMVEIEPRQESELIFYTHSGEEFLFVLEGEIEFRGSDQVILLSRGDSLYFDSEIPHALRGLRNKKAVALAVVHPSKNR